MNMIIEHALDTLTNGVNLSTGLAHHNDLAKAVDVFMILHEHGEILLKEEIVAWALQNHWSKENADQIGSLAQQIGEGKGHHSDRQRWCVPAIYDRWSGKSE
jgi:hypothetical protein